LRGLASELEKIHFLSVPLQHGMRWVGQADEGQLVLFPVHEKCLGALGSNHNHFRVLRDKLVIVLAQLRHVPAAERSEESAVEDQQNVFVSAKIRETDLVSVEVSQCEIRGGCI
jgi:hypothetical protein